MLSQIEERFDGSLTIQRTRYGEDVVVFSFSGELDLATTSDAWHLIEPALDEVGAMIVIDLTELEFLGVKGVCLLYGLAAARPDKELLRLLPSVHPGVNKVLDLTGVRQAIPTVSS